MLNNLYFLSKVDMYFLGIEYTFLHLYRDSSELDMVLLNINTIKTKLILRRLPQVYQQNALTKSILFCSSRILAIYIHIFIAAVIVFHFHCYYSFITVILMVFSFLLLFDGLLVVVSFRSRCCMLLCCYVFVSFVLCCCIV